MVVIALVLGIGAGTCTSTSASRGGVVDPVEVRVPVRIVPVSVPIVGVLAGGVAVVLLSLLQ